MLKVLAVCGNGMGTSMVIKLKVKNVLAKNKIECSLDSCSVGQAKSMVNNFDIVLCSNHLLKEVKVNERTKLIGLQNLMDEKELEAKLISAL